MTTGFYYSGRSPLEALSIGVDTEDTDIALRCNVVTVSEDRIMKIRRSSTTAGERLLLKK